MKRAKLFSLVEILIALAVSAVALMAFLTIFTQNSDHAVGSRNRSVAIMLCQGLMDDIEGHTYGNPEPRRWQEKMEEPVQVWVNGRTQKMEFHKTVTYENGSFVGNSSENNDVVTVTVSWREGFGDDQSATTDNKELVVRVPVWR